MLVRDLVDPVARVLDEILHRALREHDCLGSPEASPVGSHHRDFSQAVRCAVRAVLHVEETDERAVVGDADLAHAVNGALAGDHVILEEEHAVELGAETKRRKNRLKISNRSTRYRNNSPTSRQSSTTNRLIRLD